MTSSRHSLIVLLSVLDATAVHSQHVGNALIPSGLGNHETSSLGSPIKAVPFGPVEGGGMAISVWQHQRRSRICDALGNNSNFLVEDVSANTWATLRYQQLNLLGKTLS